MNPSKTFRLLPIILVCIFFIQSVQAQQPAPPTNTRAAALKAREAELIYPIIKAGTSTGVLPVTDVSFPFQHKGKCKLVFDLGQMAEKGKVNEGIEEVIRIINLHGAAGVKKENLDVYVVFHGPAAVSFLDDDLFNKQFQVNNPNLPMVKQLQDAGVKLVICGQTLGLRNMKLDAFPDGTLKSYSARTAVSDLVQRGYMKYEIED
ncbi:MAG TPA: DsrE family protein [Chitinophagaceae bacterium]|nr:DsrE family protein [Chitinophagaceae bacterium]